MSASRIRTGILSSDSPALSIFPTSGRKQQSHTSSGPAYNNISRIRLTDWGWELQMNATPVAHADWNWNFWVNFAKNPSEVKNFYEGVESITLLPPNGTKTCYVMAKTGKPSRADLHEWFQKHVIAKRKPALWVMTSKFMACHAYPARCR